MSANQQPWPGASDDRPATTQHGGLMPKLGAASATLGGFTVTGKGRGSTINPSAATTALAGALSAADYAALRLLDDPPRARVYRTVVQAIPGAAFTAITFDASRYNTAGSSGGSNPWNNPNLTRLTVPAGGGGTYRMSGVVFFPASNLGTTRIVGIRLNGAAASLLATAEGRPHATANALLSCATDYALVAGDYLELVVFQDTGGAFNVGAAAVTYGSELTLARCSD